MRISDWSSDVCSSDLQPQRAVGGLHPHGPTPAQRIDGACGVTSAHQKANSVMIGTWSDGRDQPRIGSTTRWLTAFSATSRARKSVVEGKSVSVRVDLGGRRLHKKKNKKNQKKA